jgi:hypothetical protein
MKCFIVIILVLFSVQCQAEFNTAPVQIQYQYLSDWDHLGIGFASQMIAYGLIKQATDDRTGAAICSFILASVITSFYEYTKPDPSYRNLLMNTIGQGFGVGTIWIFSF